MAATLFLSSCVCVSILDPDESLLDAGSEPGEDASIRPDGGTCPDGLDLCDDVCADLDADDSHCGECGNDCPPSSGCIGGECLCNIGLTLCSGECVDTSRNPDHCGECDNVCLGDAFCADGACDCINTRFIPCVDGCVDPDSDERHCGGCDIPCKPPDDECFRGGCR